MLLVILGHQRWLWKRLSLDHSFIFHFSGFWSHYGIAPITDMPTSGYLKFGDSISCTSSPPPPALQCQQTPTPHTTNQPSKLQNYDSHGNGLGHYMKSYMRYIPSRFAFIERSVCIRVCKHGCDVSCFAFRALITQARVWKSFSDRNSTSLLYLLIPSSTETWKIFSNKLCQRFFA